MDKSEIRKKILLKPLDWLTITPFMLGVSGSLFAWAGNLDPGLSLSIGIIPMLLSAGVYFHRLVNGWDKNYEEIIQEWRSTVEVGREEKLNDLHQKLKKDGDPKTENLLNDLRVLISALEKDSSKANSMSSFNVITDVDKLFNKCVDYLSETYDIWETTQNMAKESIKQPLLDHRQALISEVESSLEQIGKVLGMMKKGMLNTTSKQDMNEIRDELQSRLKMAEAVENRMSQLKNNNTNSIDEEKYLKYSDEQ